MFNFIESVIFDAAGSAKIHAFNSSDYGSTTRRVNKSQTLDGGVAVNDGGSAQGDKTLVIACKPTSQADEDALHYIVENHARVTVSTKYGVFLAVPSSFTPGPKEHTFTASVISRLAQ